MVKNGNKYDYQYVIQDHQGNTRTLFSGMPPAPLSLKATFEGNAADQVDQFTNVNPGYVFSVPLANTTPGGGGVIEMNQGYPVGPAKSLKVYPGDKIDMNVWAYYTETSGYGTTNAAMVSAIATAFGGSSGGSGESLRIYNGVNSAISGFGLGANAGDAKPAAFINYILFDQSYNVMTMGWQGVTASAGTKENLTIPTVTVKEPGYIFIYLSYEDQSNKLVFFDDFSITHTKSSVIQSSEYYPFGMQTANSWTRENVTGNNFLGNGGTELNSTSQLYDLDYRNYDPLLGRLNQIDPMADKFSSLSPYHFAYNNPVGFSDPSGALPWSRDFEDSYIGADYGTRRLDAFNRGKGNNGGVGEAGWDGYVGYFDLDKNMFGYADHYFAYSRPKAGSTSANDFLEKAQAGSGGYWNNGNATYYSSEQVEQRVGYAQVWNPWLKAKEGGGYKGGWSYATPSLINAMSKGGYELWFQFSPERKVINTTVEAFDHYFNGNGEMVEVGLSAITELVNSKGFQFRHNRITTGQTTLMQGVFRLDLTFELTFIGRTNVNYSIECAGGDCMVRYTLFQGDGFWDVDVLDEKAGKVLPFKRWQPDGLGPNLERLGGTPFPFKITSSVFYFKDPGY